MVNKKSVIPKKITRNKPAKKRVVEKDPKKGLAGAGEPITASWWNQDLAKAFSELNRSRQYVVPADHHIGDKDMFTKDPLRVAIEKFSLSLVSESMLAMVAMHGMLSGEWRSGSPGDFAEEAVRYARAVMAELKKQKEEGAK